MAGRFDGVDTGVKPAGRINIRIIAVTMIQGSYIGSADFFLFLLQ